MLCSTSLPDFWSILKIHIDNKIIVCILNILLDYLDLKKSGLSLKNISYLQPGVSMGFWLHPFSLVAVISVHISAVVS